MKKKILAFILSAIVALSIPTTMIAEASYYNLPLDVGNHHSYSHRSSGGSHRSYRSRSRSSSRSSSGSSELDPVSSVILTILFCLILVILICAIVSDVKKSKKNSTVYKNIPPMFPYNATEQIAVFIKQNDENFDTEKFLAWTKNIFITIQTAWSQRDWEQIRTLEKEELFEQHNIQLQEYINLGRINVMENINVVDAYLHKFVIDENFENLTVSLRATMNDYIIDETSGKVLMGNKNEVFDTIYQMTFTRRKGIKTNIVNNVIANVCPNCGAVVQSASAGKCEYCGSIVHTGEFNWVLSNLESVDKNFVDDKRGIIFPNNKF